MTNNTGRNLDIAFEGITINDYISSECFLGLFDEKVLANNHIAFELNISNDFKSKNGNDKINKVDFYLEYKISGDYSSTSRIDNMSTIIN